MEEIDPTSIAAISSAIGGANLISKVLGPTAEYIGDEIATLTKSRVENIRRIFCIAGDKLGARANLHGTVPPRVLACIVNQGSYCNADIVSEYFGGILAASKNDEDEDDRGVAYASLVSRLPTRQILAHYVLYHIVYKTQSDRPLDFDHVRHVDGNDFLRSLGLEDARDRFQQAQQVAAGLDAEKLIETTHLQIDESKARPSVYSFLPTHFGALLFLWAHGLRNVSSEDLHKQQIDPPDVFVPTSC